MKFENVKIGQRVQAKVDIYRFPYWENKGCLIIKKGRFGEVIGVSASNKHLNAQVKWDELVEPKWGDKWWCNHKDIRKVSESKEVKVEVPQNKITVGDKVKLIKTDITDAEFGYCGGVMLKVGEDGVVNAILVRQVPAVRIGDYCYAIEDLELVKEED